MESDAGVVLDQRIRTDIEEFWDHYQKDDAAAKSISIVMAQSHGELRPEFAPPFDTLKIDFHMSEPDYELGIDKERISSLEALQEDTFYSTENFVNMMGDLEAGAPSLTPAASFRLFIAPGRMTAKTGTCTSSFTPSPPAIRWSSCAGPTRTGKPSRAQARFVCAAGDPMQPRLIAARVKASWDGRPRLESLTWLLHADYKEDDHDEWVARGTAGPGGARHFLRWSKRVGKLRWLEAMQDGGVYTTDLAGYPRLHTDGLRIRVAACRARTKSTAPRRANSCRGKSRLRR